MKRFGLLMVAALMAAGPALATRRKRVLHSSAAETNESKTTAKVSDVQTTKKPLSRSLQSWLRDLKKRVAKTNARPNQVVAVASVRGDETPDAPPLYWKGRTAEGNVAQTELNDFDAALDVALNGDPAVAKDKLQAFLQAYPKSSLTSDAQETMKRLESPPAP